MGFLVLKLDHLKTPGENHPLLFSVLILLACAEKLCSIMNTVSIERDWVGRDLAIVLEDPYADAHSVYQVVAIADADNLRLQSGYCLV